MINVAKALSAGFSAAMFTAGRAGRLAAIAWWAGLPVLIAAVVGCDSAQQPAKPRAPLGAAEAPPPPPPPAPAAAGSASSRPAAPAAATESTDADVSSAPPEPATSASALSAEQEAKLEAADASKWRNDYYAFRKNVSVEDGKVSWGQMKPFARVFELAHASGEAQMDAMRENDPTKKRALGNKFLKLNAEARDAIEKLGKLNWTAKVVSNPRRRREPVQLDLPPLPEPARVTFFVPDEEEPRWDLVQDGDPIRFRCGLTWGGSPESPELTVKMHLLD